MMSYLGYHHLLPLVRDVQGGTIMDKGVAPLITPVVRERVTVMVVVMGGGMMGIEGARVTWYVVETTARSLVLTTMRRMTVVRSLAIKDGGPGVAGHLNDYFYATDGPWRDPGGTFIGQGPPKSATQGQS